MVLLWANLFRTHAPWIFFSKNVCPIGYYFIWSVYNHASFFFWYADNCNLFWVFYSAPGMTVAYTAPARHWCLKVVENNYCASKRGMSHEFMYGLNRFIRWPRRWLAS